MNRNVGRRALFSVLPLLALVLGSEALLRVMGWPPSKGTKPFEHSEPYWITDPDLHEHEFSHREMNAAFKVSTDARGLRYPLHDLEKPSGTKRIMFLGCSTTFGWGVDDAQSYPARVEQMLAERGASGIEILNGGQPGYTSFQGLWFFKNTARLYKPDVVVFGYIVQDARRAAYTDRSQAAIQRDARFLKDNFLYRFNVYLGLRELIDRVRVRTKERSQTGSEGTWRVPPEDYVANIREMNALVRAEGGELVLFGFPLEREGYTKDHRRLLRIAGEELGLRHFDPQPEMETESRQRNLYFTSDRGHANADGNGVIAGWVVDWMDREGIVPPAVRKEP